MILHKPMKLGVGEYRQPLLNRIYLTEKKGLRNEQRDG